MKIRHYSTDDLDACRSLWTEMVQQHRDVYGDQTIGGDNPGLEFDKHLKKVGANSIWLAESNGEVVGFTSIIIKEQEAELEPIVVSMKHRGKGTGPLLIQHAVKEAKKKNILCLYVKPVARNKEAITFFYKQGFRTVGHIQLFMWLGEDDQVTWEEGMEIFGKKFYY